MQNLPVFLLTTIGQNTAAVPETKPGSSKSPSGYLNPRANGSHALLPVLGNLALLTI